MKIISKVKGKIQYWRRTISFYYWEHDFKIDTENFPKNLNFREITCFSDLGQIELDTTTETVYKNRFSEGNTFCVLEDFNKIVSYGWVNPTNQHYLGELALMMDLHDTIEVLYDFYTFTEYRGQGFYPYLLLNICKRNSNKKLIYAFRNNKSSIKGIIKANFKFLGTINGFNKSKYSLLLNKI